MTLVNAKSIMAAVIAKMVFCIVILLMVKVRVSPTCMPLLPYSLVALNLAKVTHRGIVYLWWHGRPTPRIEGRSQTCEEQEPDGCR